MRVRRQSFTPRCGEFNHDGDVDFANVNRFVQILTDPAGCSRHYPVCDILNGDVNGGARGDFSDINPFVALLSGA